MPNSVLTYDAVYLLSFPDGTTLERMFDALRLGPTLKQPLLPINIGALPTPLHGPHLGQAWVQIQGIHQRGEEGRKWFLEGRFRNRMAPPHSGQPEGGAWDDAYFSGTWNLWSCVGLLKTAKESFFTSPVRRYEKDDRILVSGAAR